MIKLNNFHSKILKTNNLHKIYNNYSFPLINFLNKNIVEKYIKNLDLNKIYTDNKLLQTILNDNKSLENILRLPNNKNNFILNSSLPLKKDKPRLIIIGSGWGGARLIKDIDCYNKYDITLISNNNHIVFTPLLASTCVGTVHSQSVIENIRHIQPGLKLPQNHFYLSSVNNINFDKKIIECESNSKSFNLNYDKLVICAGGSPATYNIPGVKENVFFLKNIHDAINIRKKLLENICLAGIPNLLYSERNKLLNFVIVGGGPTGVELASELCNFINEDMYTYNPNIKTGCKITLIEGNEVLNNFDKDLKLYAINNLIKGGVYIKKAQVKKINKEIIELDDGSKIEYGMCIWSTGVEPNQLIKKLLIKKSKSSKILVDQNLRVIDLNNNLNTDVYALGDCSEIIKNPLPTLAQVAEQQGKYLAYNLNYNCNKEFEYKHLGSMICLTTGKGILEFSSKFKLKGILSWIIWRSAYLTKLQSFKNKINIMSQWTGTLIKGREIGF